MLTPAGCMSLPAAAFKREALEKAGGFDAVHNNTGDLLTIMRVAVQGNVLYGQHIGATRWENSRNYSSGMTKRAKRNERGAAINQCVQELDRLVPDWEKRIARHLLTHKDGTLFIFLRKYVRFGATCRLQRLYWQALQQVRTGSKIHTWRLLYSRLGMKNFLKFLKSVYLSR